MNAVGGLWLRIRRFPASNFSNELTSLDIKPSGFATSAMSDNRCELRHSRSADYHHTDATSGQKRRRISRDKNRNDTRSTPQPPLHAAHPTMPHRAMPSMLRRQNGTALASTAPAPVRGVPIRVTTVVLFALPLVVSVIAAAGTPADPCAQAQVVIETRLPESVQARWLKALSDCKPTAAGQRLLGQVHEEATGWAQSELEFAAAQERAGNVKEQLSHLKLALAHDPGNPQIVAGIQAAQQQYARITVAQAEALLANDKTDDAIKLLSDAASQDIASQPINDLLASMQNAPLSKLHSQTELGRYSDATNTLQALLELNPTVPVDSLTRDSAGLRWGYWRGRLTSWAIYVLEALAALVILGWILARLWYWGLARPLLVLGDFDNHTVAPGMEQAIEAMLIKLTSSDTSPASIEVTRPLESTPLPVQIGSAVPFSTPWLNALLGLVANVLPRRTVPIQGVLHNAAALGAGITIHVRTSRGENLSETFWTNRFGHKTPQAAKETAAPNAYYYLAEYIAIWLLFKLSKPPFSFLGAKDWRSYAYFHAGNYAKEMEDLDTAKHLYVKALDIDGNLHAARLNLARLAEEDERFLVDELLRSAATKADRSDATRYIALYDLAVLEYDQGEEATARTHIIHLLQDMAESCDEFGWQGLKTRLMDILQRLTSQGEVQKARSSTTSKYLRRWGNLSAPEYGELEQCLGSLTSFAEVMLAGILLKSDPSNPAARQTLQSPERDQSSRVGYAVACDYSILAAAEAGQPGGGNPQTVRGHLQTSLKAFQLALWMEGDLAKTAIQDRSLAYLRESDFVVDHGETAAALFTKVLTRYPTGKPKEAIDPALPLSAFAVIGEDYAKALASKGILTVADLCLYCIEPCSVERLADSLDIGVRQVRAWVETVELTRIPGVQPPQANLLNKAGIYSLDNLRAHYSIPLAAQLADWAKTLHINPPKLTEVESWITAAGGLRPYLI